MNKMAFVPPQFKDFGKKVSDLLKKGYDFKNEFKIINKSSNVIIETSASHTKSLDGNCKITHTDKSIGGNVEVNVSSAGAASATNAKLTFDKLIPSGKVSISGNAAPSANLETTYAKDFFAGTLNLGSNFAGKNTATASGALGFDNVAVGGAASFCATSGTAQDYNVGAEYSTKDLTATMVTSNKTEDITTSFFQKMSSTFSVGTRLNIEGEAGSRTLAVGSDYTLDKSTNVKTSFDSNGIVNVNVCHILANPAAKINVAAQFDALSSDIFKANKFGIGVTVGDF
jgi:hypothetical protein